MDTIRNRGVLALLNLSTIKRWQIVDMHREQSVAEHQYRVWVLAQDLYSQLAATPHNSNDRWAVHLWALVHDAEEISTGDLPSPYKDAIREESPMLLDRIKNRFLAKIVPWAASLARGTEHASPSYVVKIADICESILFVRMYAVNLERAVEVEAYLAKALSTTLARAQGECPTYKWAVATKWCEELLGEGLWSK